MQRHLTPIHRAVIRPELFMEAERIPAMMLIFPSFMLSFSGFTHKSWAAGIIGAVVLFAGMRALRKLAKRDPMWFAVFLRRIVYRQSYYPAHSTPYRTAPPPALSRRKF